MEHLVALYGSQNDTLFQKRKIASVNTIFILIVNKVIKQMLDNI